MVKSQLDYVFCPFCTKALNIKLEEEKERKYCRECKWTHYPSPHIAVSGIAIRNKPLSGNKKLQILMVRRNREPFKNMWSLPAGFVDYGEHPETALQREVREETGLTVARYQLFRMRISNDDPRSPNQLSLSYKIDVVGEIQYVYFEENSAVNLTYLDPLNNMEIAWNNHRNLFEMASKEPDLFLFSNPQSKKGETE